MTTHFQTSPIAALDVKTSAEAFAAAVPPLMASLDESLTGEEILKHAFLYSVESLMPLRRATGRTFGAPNFSAYLV